MNATASIDDHGLDTGGVITEGEHGWMLVRHRRGSIGDFARLACVEIALAADVGRRPRAYLSNKEAGRQRGMSQQGIRLEAPLCGVGIGMADRR